MKQKVVITDYEYPQVDQERKIITEYGAELVTCQLKGEQELAAALRDADAVIVQYAEITASVIEAMERCKIIIKYGIGVNNIDAGAAGKKGIYVCNVPDYGVDEVSNHAIAMLLALAKKLPIVTSSLRGGNWGYQCTVPLYRLSGSVLGLVGFGRIPALVANKMAGFDMKILAYDPYARPQTAAKIGVELVDFDTLCRQSDFVSIHCPLTPETTHLFRKETFFNMKSSAFLINTARGPIVHEQDLVEALQQKQIAGAALDVYESEPLSPDCQLLKLDNLIATPHCAWYSEQAVSSLQRMVAEEVVRVLGGEPPQNCTNRKLLEN